VARQRALDETQGVVVLDGRHADHDVADLQGRVEAARGAGAGHGAHGRLLIDQVLRLHSMLGFTVSADRDEHAELLETLTLLATDVDARPGVTSRSEGTGDALQLSGLRDRDECLGAFHIGLAASGLRRHLPFADWSFAGRASP